MNRDDLLIYSDKLETPDMRPQWFHYQSNPGKQELAPMHRVVFDLLNIDPSFYKVETNYDEFFEAAFHPCAITGRSQAKV
jgi:hypothetical protein